MRTALGARLPPDGVATQAELPGHGAFAGPARDECADLGMTGLASRLPLGALALGARGGPRGR